MRLCKSRLLWMAIVIGATACSSKDNSDPPALLTELENPIALTIRWDKDTDAEKNNASYNLRPLLVDNRLFTIDTAGYITSIDAENGRRNWDYESKLPVMTGLGGNSSVLVVCSADGDVVVFDRTGQGLEKRWSVRLSGEIRSVPVVDGEQVFVRTVAGKLSALSLADGAVQWSISRRIPALSLTGNSSPVVDGNRVIIGFDDGRLAAFNRKDGRVIWEKVISHASGRTEIERLVDIDGDFLLKDGILYVSTYQGRLSALQSINGDVLWSRKFSSYQPIVADEDALYISGDMSHVWSIDRRTGSAFWKQEALHARKITAPEIIGDKIVVADMEGYVHWLEKSDGSLKGRSRPSDSRYISQPLRFNDSIIVQDISGLLTSIAAR